MRRIISCLLASLLVLLMPSVSSAALPTAGGPSTGPIVITPTPRPGPLKPIPIAFSAVANRYTDVDPVTVFDLNGDLVGDLTVSSIAVIGKNGATVQLLEPAVLSLDQVQSVPASGYSASAPLQLSRVYTVKMSAGYAKFMLLQASPKVTIWFHFGVPTPSELKVDGTGGHAVLTWGALPDAALGYNIYRYEFLDNSSYTVTLLNDFTVQETTFTDNTAENHYYLYVVVAMKSGGAFGSSTTVAAVQVQSLQRSLVVNLLTGTATLDGAPITMDAPPVVKNGRMMVPATLMTNAGVKFTFDESSGHITLTRRLDNVTYSIQMTLDLPDYTWNDASYKADVPPYKAGSVVMIPLRVVAPALGYGLSFNSTDRTATVSWFE